MPTPIPALPGSGKSLLDRVEDSLLPLINLVFLLLMFFIVAGHLTESPLPQLPAVSEQTRLEAGLPNADLIIKADGAWHVDGKPLTKTSLLRALPDPETGRPLRIAADQGTSMADLGGLLNLLARGGYRNVTLLTEPQS